MSESSIMSCVTVSNPKSCAMGCCNDPGIADEEVVVALDEETPGTTGIVVVVVAVVVAAVDEEEEEDEEDEEDEDEEGGEGDEEVNNGGEVEEAVAETEYESCGRVEVPVTDANNEFGEVASCVICGETMVPPPAFPSEPA